MARFEILGRVVGGSSATVWKARDLDLDRTVALKLVAADAAVAEATALAAIRSDHVVAVHDVVRDGADTYLVEEWVEGATLAAVLREHGRLDAVQALGVMRGALLGLAEAHRLGLVHGDVATANIMVTGDGVAKLVDFGSAGRVGERARPGTGAYSAPETLSGGVATTATDVFAAAAVLAGLLHGRADTRPSLAGVDPALRPVLERALADDPAARYPDAAAFLTALEQACSRRYGPAWWTRAGLGAAAVGAAATVVAAGAGGPFTGGTVTGTGGPVAAGAGGPVAAGAGGPVAAGAGGPVAAGAGGPVAVGAGGPLRRASRTRLLAGAGVGAGILVAGVVAAIALTGGDDERPAGQGRASATLDAADRTTAPAASSTPPPPRARPTGVLGSVAGTYRAVYVVTSSRGSRASVGRTSSGTVTASVTCGPPASGCRGTLGAIFGNSYPIAADGTVRGTTTIASTCFDDVTGAPRATTTSRARLSLTATGPATGPTGFRGSIVLTTAPVDTCAAARVTYRVTLDR